MATLQCPHAVGLTLCRLVMVEERTRNVTLASTFHRLAVRAFPARPDPFHVYAMLTDGLGEFDLSLEVCRCDTLEEIYVRTHRVKSKDPRAKQRILWRIRSCVFPAPGDYEFGLRADGELITQNVVNVVTIGDSHV